MRDIYKSNSHPIIVIGASAWGLVIAIGATKAGKKVLLIEKGPYGVDRTNFGCIPSKSLIASAHFAFAINEAKELGIDSLPFILQTNKTLSRVRSIVDKIRSQEVPEALNKLGLETKTGSAKFEVPNTLRFEGGLSTASKLLLLLDQKLLFRKLKVLIKHPFSQMRPFFNSKKFQKVSQSFLAG